MQQDMPPAPRVPRRDYGCGGSVPSDDSSDSDSIDDERAVPAGVSMGFADAYHADERRDTSSEAAAAQVEAARALGRH